MGKKLGERNFTGMHITVLMLLICFVALYPVWYTQEDGHVYGYPNASFTPEDYVKYKGKIVSNETFLVRKDIYEALGKPDMTTPEGFLKALRAAKKKFPKAGELTLIPFGTHGKSVFANITVSWRKPDWLLSQT